MSRLLAPLLSIGVLLGATTAWGAEPTTSAPARPHGPLLEALAYVMPGTAEQEIEFTDWAGLKAVQERSDVTGLSPLQARQDLIDDIVASEAAPIPEVLQRSGSWSAQWGWDATDLDWHLRIGPSTAVLHFGEHWDPAGFIARLEGRGYADSGSGTYHHGPSTRSPTGSDLERVIGDLPVGAPLQPRADVTFATDGRTVIIDRTMAGSRIAERAADIAAAEVAATPFGRIAESLDRPLVAVVRSGDLGCSPDGENNGLLRADAVPLARSAGQLRPYEAYGAGYERTAEGPSVGRFVFDYDTAEQARADLKGRRSLIAEGVMADGRRAYRDAAFTLEGADVQGHDQSFVVRPVDDRPSRILDVMASEPALLAMCGALPAKRPLSKLPAYRVPAFVGPATLNVSGGRGAYAWDEVHFGADQVRVAASVAAGQVPCSARLRLDDKDGRVSTANFAAAPRKERKRSDRLTVDYATATMRVDSTCDSWSLRFEPIRDPDLKYSIKSRSYRVRGSTVQALADDIDRVRGKWAARAKWRTFWRFSWEGGGPTCRVTRGDVEVKASIIMPKWKRPRDADPSVVARWDRFARNLHLHEQGHITFALQGAHAVNDRLDAGVTASCKEVQGKTNRIAGIVIKRWNKLDDRYDKETDHGITQGTAFP